ncbi:hypothetical protein GYMLUDRAFT_195633 [Collybiopsis luxurians FD-317 M1]|uniref:Uncharacterized protein n=1 Tax=Collybiopsis luxurians FD-317 M1 TaxID=944289 RepID=A0A0D0CLP8_9AGAR|nr:hypothetical protein GYMLUDRAFT_195633 [Collybiopsis luxurians FD-317 M1]
MASGDAGKYWAKGCKLGEQIGGVYVDKIQVGLIFNPPWSQSTIIVSETFARLPIAFMHPYAETLVGELKASSFSLLDTYPTPTYVSSRPIAFQDAPIRYISTSQPNSAIVCLFCPLSTTSSSEPFPPPNLVHSSTSAALLSLIASRFPHLNATLLVLPFPRILPPAPKVLGNSDFSHLSDDEYQWSAGMMGIVHTLLFSAVGQKPGAPWQTPSNSKASGAASARNRAPVNDGMYI